MLALREFSQVSKAWEHVFPVIEPVKLTFNGINKALEVLNSRNMPVAIVQNPQVGDLVGNETLIETDITYLPNCKKAYIVRDDLQFIEQKLGEAGKGCILIIPIDAVFEDEGLLKLCAHENVNIVLACDKYKNIKRKLRNLNPKPNVVLMSDNFNARQRNADYQNAEDEMFSEDYFYYKEDNFDGVSDYTVLPSQYSEGGRLPYAVAIHLTYQKGDQIRIRHFISDSNYGTEDIQGKFKEAASKAVEFSAEHKIETAGTNLLKFYLEEGIYPGLGMLKKISILHHLETVKSVMENDVLF